MENQMLLQTDDGKLLWLNPETNAYEFIQECLQSEDKESFTICSTTSSGIPGTSSQVVSHVAVEDQQLDEKSSKLWNDEDTLLLISFVKKYNDELERGIKKFVWKKISEEIFKVSKKKVSIQQVETKWKGLVRYYKDVTKWNDTSGNSKKDWKFFKVVDEILFKRPEINAEAICDSNSGLWVKTTKGMVKTNFNEHQDLSRDQSDEISDMESGPNSFEGRFSRKRKQRESAASKRHNEKMLKLDRLADIMDRLVNAVQTTKNSGE